MTPAHQYTPIWCRCTLLHADERQISYWRATLACFCTLVTCRKFSAQFRRIYATILWQNVVIRVWEQVILIRKKTPEDMNYSNWSNVPAYYLRQPVPIENLGESDKKDVLNLIDVKWRRNVEKSTLKVHHKNISEIEKAKSTMTALDMNFYGYR